MFLPSDISERVGNFIAGGANFPIIGKEEIMGIFYLFGKNYGIKGQTEIMSATDLARRTIEQLAKNVRYFHNMPSKLDSNSVREDYIKRVLQISIELQQNRLGQKPKLSSRIAR
ncbi:MAG TPA: hypothetical protein VJ551_04380, partial [Nitrososphaeraceae archaeon]|nr:hypothetical protein [Nitrososphaeraceae archaeon]